MRHLCAHEQGTLTSSKNEFGELGKVNADLVTALICGTFPGSRMLCNRIGSKTTIVQPEGNTTVRGFNVEGQLYVSTRTCRPSDRP